MTEQIKSAIADFQEWINRAEDFNPNVQSKHVKAMKLSIRSLQAWDEVLKELEETKTHATDLVKPKFLGKELKEITDMCFDEAICIINKHCRTVKGEENGNTNSTNTDRC